MITSETHVIEIVRLSTNHRDKIYQIFNHSKKNCFGCTAIAHLTLEKACDLHSLHFKEILNDLQKITYPERDS